MRTPASRENGRRRKSVVAVDMTSLLRHSPYLLQSQRTAKTKLKSSKSKLEKVDDFCKIISVHFCNDNHLLSRVFRYIQEDILKPDDPYFRTFFRVFETFRIQEPEVKKQDTPSVSVLVAKAALESKRLAAQRQDDSDDEEEEGDKEQPKISKKKLRRMNRLSVAQLKQLVERPDVVEMHDVTAPDPQLLIHLKVINW